tara:strand:+ start:900 stop:1418 length:519 start_codon:yes stop_codon:yes gene_type:complete
MKIIIVIPCGISIKKKNIVVSSTFRLILDNAIYLNDNKSLICIPSGNDFGFNKSEQQCAKDYLQKNGIRKIFTSNHSSTKYIDTFEGLNNLLLELKSQINKNTLTIISYSFQADRVNLILKKLNIRKLKAIKVKPSKFFYFELMPLRQLYYLCTFTHFLYEIIAKIYFKISK